MAYPHFINGGIQECHKRLHQIKNGFARDVIRHNLEMFAGNQLGPVTVGAWPTERLNTIAQFLPDPFLAHCLGYLMAESQPSFSGFPDLLLYPSSLNPNSHSVLPSAIPSRLPKDHLWIEVKGPNDRAHAGQKAWHHHFLDCRTGRNLGTPARQPGYPVQIRRCPMDIVEEVKMHFGSTARLGCPGSGASGHFENFRTVERV